MERKRVGGRFVKAGAVPEVSEAGGAEAAGAMLKAPRPRQCRAYVRKRMAEQMPEVVEMLMQQAKMGSLGHLKILVALAGLDKGDVDKAVKRREKSLEKILLDQWEEGDAVPAEDVADEGLE